MLEQVSTSVKFLAFFTASKQGKTGLTVTVDLYDPSGSQIVTGGSATAIGGGLYAYTLSTNNSAEGEYAAIFKTTDSTVDSQHIPSLWVLGRAGVENLDASVSSRSTLTAAQVNAEADAALADVGLTTTITGRIDQAISTRLASSAYTAPTTPPTAAEIATAVEGSLLNEADGQAVLNAIVGAIGNTNLSEVSLVAAIRSDIERSGGKLDSVPTAAANASAVWGTATKTITGGVVDTLTNSPSVPSAASIAAATRTELAVELARVDQNISSRLAAADYSAPSAAPTAAQNASAVWSATARTITGGLVDTATNVTNSTSGPTAAQIRSEIDANSTQLSGIKSKTDALPIERLQNCATTAIVGNLIAQANS